MSDKIKCVCINCGWRQMLERHTIDDCEHCGNYINCEEDSEYQIEEEEE
jgi:hypothetical protein